MSARIEHHRSRMSFLAALSFTMLACYAHDPAQSAAPGRLGVGDVVSREELVASGASSLYDALVRTRRNFFWARGVTSLNNPPADAILVFRDGAIMGTINVLSMMRATDVRSVRRLSATETYHRYGRNVSVGGLEVELVDMR
ncbi:MAG TPA: hypothetical protein VJT85_07550 [Gemmatimonadaceae bacterium]|nr:hypothetical protein [Gemmatimonadaceae bacterium]